MMKSMKNSSHALKEVSHYAQENFTAEQIKTKTTVKTMITQINTKTNLVITNVVSVACLVAIGKQKGSRLTTQYIHFS
jgi:hypothetical protein